MTFDHEKSKYTEDDVTYRVYVYVCSTDNNWITHEEPQESSEV